jgi:hypothetical protein
METHLNSKYMAHLNINGHTLKTFDFRQADVRQRSVNSDKNMADISWK